MGRLVLAAIWVFNVLVSIPLSYFMLPSWLYSQLGTVCLLQVTRLGSWCKLRAVRWRHSVS
jgi:hypothetical protein